jgi:hypothetical protein
MANIQDDITTKVPQYAVQETSPILTGQVAPPLTLPKLRPLAEVSHFEPKNPSIILGDLSNIIDEQFLKSVALAKIKVGQLLLTKDPLTFEQAVTTFIQENDNADEDRDPETLGEIYLSNYITILTQGLKGFDITQDKIERFYLILQQSINHLGFDPKNVAEAIGISIFANGNIPGIQSVLFNFLQKFYPYADVLEIVERRLREL